MTRMACTVAILAAGLSLARTAAAEQVFWSAQCTRLNISGSCTGDTVTLQTPTSFEDVACNNGAYQWISAPGQVSPGNVIHVFTPAQQNVTAPPCPASAPGMGGSAMLLLGAALGIAGLASTRGRRVTA